MDRIKDGTYCLVLSDSNKTEYQQYMKRVTDSFIEMNRATVTNWNLDNSVFYVVKWEFGLDFSLELCFSRAIVGVTPDEIREYNRRISLRYLNENSISYEKWLKNKNKL